MPVRSIFTCTSRKLELLEEKSSNASEKPKSSPKKIAMEQSRAQGQNRDKGRWESCFDEGRKGSSQNTVFSAADAQKYPQCLLRLHGRRKRTEGYIKNNNGRETNTGGLVSQRTRCYIDKDELPRQADTEGNRISWANIHHRKLS